MLYLFRSSEGKRCRRSCDRILVRCFGSLARGQESKIEEGHVMVDHVHMLISIPRKYSVAHVIGYIKGQSCDTHCAHLRRPENEFCGSAFLGRGYYVSTVGGDEQVIREYIRTQEKEDARQDQLEL